MRRLITFRRKIPHPLRASRSEPPKLISATSLAVRPIRRSFRGREIGRRPGWIRRQTRIRAAAHPGMFINRRAAAQARVSALMFPQSPEGDFRGGSRVKLHSARNQRARVAAAGGERGQMPRPRRWCKKSPGNVPPPLAPAPGSISSNLSRSPVVICELPCPASPFSVRHCFALRSCVSGGEVSLCGRIILKCGLGV